MFVAQVPDPVSVARPKLVSGEKRNLFPFTHARIPDAIAVLGNLECQKNQSLMHAYRRRMDANSFAFSQRPMENIVTTAGLNVKRQ